MSVRVVARIRPLLKSERELDVIVRTGSNKGEKKNIEDSKALAALRDRDTLVRIPNPKHEHEEYSFQFNAVYDAEVAQQEVFDAEVAPTVKHLFNGFDVTLFAYGVTGTGKTHTMRGGKSLADRGVIPRLLSNIYRRGRKIEKDSEGATSAKVSLSYYEIYNDKVFDLFEPPEKRTPSGLPLRDNGGKTVVVGLTEKSCTNLKEFETLYDQANTNRSTSATKLNAHSSRSHAILCVKLTVISGDKTRVSTASAIDLAGSEDNRRTENGKERMVESASINKSLFVLAQCVEAMSKKQQRIPYRESKMTRILSLGQNHGLTVMILNLAPVRGYHLDTLSSLNFANRTKKIEVREVENEPMFKGPPRPAARPSMANVSRQPLRPLAASVNANLPAPGTRDASKPVDEKDSKPAKAFHVYSDKPQPRRSAQFKKPEAPKRPSLTSDTSRAPHTHLPKPSRPSQVSVPPQQQHNEDISAAMIEEMVQKKVEEILAVRAVSEKSRQTQVRELNDQVQKRLEMLEHRIEGTEDARAEGLSYLLMAKQHQGRGENHSALKMYQLALPYFPNNAKLAVKISSLQERIHEETRGQTNENGSCTSPPAKRGGLGSMLSLKQSSRMSEKKRSAEETDHDYEEPGSGCEIFSDDEDLHSMSRRKKRTKTAAAAAAEAAAASAPDIEDSDVVECDEMAPSPRTIHLLSIVNSRDVSQIKLLKGVGVKKAEAIVDCLCEMDQRQEPNQDMEDGTPEPSAQISSLLELSKLKGVGARTVESMRTGVLV